MVTPSLSRSFIAAHAIKTGQLVRLGSGDQMVAQFGNTSEPLPGSMWVDGKDFRYVDQYGNERVIRGKRELSLNCGRDVRANDGLARASWKVAREFLDVLPNGDDLREFLKMIVGILIIISVFVASPVLVPIVAWRRRESARRDQAEQIACKLEGTPRNNVGD